eukprot:3313356-Amphidinium_carterae.1
MLVQPAIPLHVQPLPHLNPAQGRWAGMRSLPPCSEYLSNHGPHEDNVSTLSMQHQGLVKETDTRTVCATPRTCHRRTLHPAGTRCVCVC